MENSFNLLCIIIYSSTLHKILPNNHNMFYIFASVYISPYAFCSGTNVTISPFSTADRRFSSTNSSISFCVS